MSDSSQAATYLQRAYSLSNPAENEDLYSEWATSYDSDLANLNYACPEKAVEALLQNLKAPQDDQKPLQVLDAGCGTGQVGETLSQRGGFVIDGVDLTPGMLEVARKKGVYWNLDVADLTKPLRIPDGKYDIVLCVGTLTKGHVGPAVFQEFARVTKAGGLIIGTVHGEIWESHGYKSTVEKLMEDSVLDIVSTDEFGIIRDHESGGIMVVLRKK